MDNFHCACYCWSSEPKGKEKNDFDNIIMGYWYFFINEDYNSVSLLYSSNKLQRFEVYIENYPIGITKLPTWHSKNNKC